MPERAEKPLRSRRAERLTAFPAVWSRRAPGRRLPGFGEGVDRRFRLRRSFYALEDRGMGSASLMRWVRVIMSFAQALYPRAHISTRTSSAGDSSRARWISSARSTMAWESASGNRGRTYGPCGPRWPRVRPAAAVSQAAVLRRDD